MWKRRKNPIHKLSVLEEVYILVLFRAVPVHLRKRQIIKPSVLLLAKFQEPNYIIYNSSFLFV